MATTNVYNYIDRVAGDPLVSVVVNITLSWDTSESPVARDIDDETMVRGTYGAESDDDGYWEVALVPNDEISPSGSLYKVVERITATEEVATYYIEVPGAATPEVWVGSILEDEPDWA